jgi:hypothetical protein
MRAAGAARPDRKRVDSVGRIFGVPHWPDCRCPLRVCGLQRCYVIRRSISPCAMDRMIAEHDTDNRSAHCHLLSVIGNDQEIAAIAASEVRLSQRMSRPLRQPLHFCRGSAGSEQQPQA